jgi:hypothetical protein
MEMGSLAEKEKGQRKKDKGKSGFFAPMNQGLEMTARDSTMRMGERRNPPTRGGQASIPL